MVSFVALLIFAVASVFLYRGIRDGRALNAGRMSGIPSRIPSRERAAAYPQAAGRTVRTTQSAARAGTSRAGDALRAAAISPSTATERRVVLAALIAAVTVAALLGGFTPALLMTGAAVAFLVPVAVIQLKTRRELTGLLQESQVTQDQPLFIPEDWHQR